MSDIETNTETNTETSSGTSTGTGTGADAGAGAGVGSVVGGLGFVGGGVVDLGGVVGGPFVTVDIVDDTNTVIAVTAVTDTDTLPTNTPTPDTDGSGEGVVGVVGEVLGVVCGGRVMAGVPVGSAQELVSRFQLPTTAVLFTHESNPGVQVIVVTTTDRRTNTQTPGTQTPGTQTQTSGTPTQTPGQTPGMDNAHSPGVPVGRVGSGVGGLDKLINVALEVSVELGRTRVTLADVLDYDVGSVIELDRAAGAPVDIRVNDTLLAQGEVVLIDDEYAVRVTAIIEPNQT